LSGKRRQSWAYCFRYLHVGNLEASLVLALSRGLEQRRHRNKETNRCVEVCRIVPDHRRLLSGE
jgi:hypothetical protein